jgi:predicted RNA binding protein YcfA (HicA-like mRNA interferase family)
MPLSYKQVQKILNEYAFTYVRQKGSHEQWIANWKLATIPHTKEYPQKLQTP